MEPYLVIVIKNPTAKAKHDEGTVAQIVVQPTAVMAKDETQAAMKAHRLVPEEHAKNEDLLEVRVLSFRSVATAVRV
jgi:hypothetical protein